MASADIARPTAKCSIPSATWKDIMHIPEIAVARNSAASSSTAIRRRFPFRLGEGLRKALNHAPCCAIWIAIAASNSSEAAMCRISILKVAATWSCTPE